MRAGGSGMTSGSPKPPHALAKRDLGKLGVASLEQLERPLPEGIIIDARVALRRGDDGDGIQPSQSVRCRRHRARRARAVRTRRRAGQRLDGRRGRLRLADGATGRGCRVMTARPHGFRVVGHRAGRRRLIDWRAAFAAYAACDPAAQPEREAYLSHFVFGADFAELPGAERLGSRLQRPVRGRLALLGHRPAGRPGDRPERRQAARRGDPRPLPRTRRRRPARLPERREGVAHRHPDRALGADPVRLLP